MAQRIDPDGQVLERAASAPRDRLMPARRAGRRLGSATESLRARLAKLHQYGIEILGCVPERQRVLVTSHDAFRYFGEAYHMDVESLQGISTESEATLSRMTELKRILVERNVSSVFTESSVPKKAIEALILGTKQMNHDVRIADSLYSDAMGREGEYEGTYIGMMDHNFTTIARALGCDSVPEMGFRGWDIHE